MRSCLISKQVLASPDGTIMVVWFLGSVLSNKLSRIKISKLISFLTENENLIKQPPDATSSSDSDPDFSPSPRAQTYGLTPSRGSISRTLISPPTSI
ncbi:hypothetical protein AVEN_48300-1 [Araneus ventricosus]|uniref:Uncharacterized protein n=1 Tax=Araneus ventricosus TaxID=182803 RepID=A0A4Y2JAB5_ARAVE|nr:hypothetical protein AVEN_48300-1 [Araneus ventricosus]